MLFWRILLAGLATRALACSGHEGFREVDIHATEYTFRVPQTLPPGLTAFRFINDGAVSHEVQLFRFRPGTTPEAAGRLIVGDRIADADADAWGSVLIANAGHTALERILVPLVRGELYALMCQFRNADSLPRHAKLGMVALLRVD
jgi:hypothetical protein